MFYPDVSTTLAAEVDRYLDAGDLRLDTVEASGEAAPDPARFDTIKGVIAPHAGYRYSGRTAGVAYAALRRRSLDTTRVVLVGPAHRVFFHGVALPGVEALRTPLGDMSVDAASCERLRAEPFVDDLPAAHAEEHSLEVHLPFLQRLFPQASVVPMLIGRTDREIVARALDLAWGGDETVVVISTDLSHFHDAATARRIDADTMDKLANHVRDDIDPRQACGAAGLNGLAFLEHERPLRREVLDLCNSSETSGTPERVVGYGAVAFWERRS